MGFHPDFGENPLRELFVTKFERDVLVSVIDTTHLAFGRIGKVLCSRGGSSLVKFTDLPSHTEPRFNAGTAFLDEQIQLIEGIPIADFYLVVTVDEQNGSQNYTTRCLAHGNIPETPEGVADAIAQNWYEDGGEWNQDEDTYEFSSDRPLRSSVGGVDEISVFQYVTLSNWMVDNTPGYQKLAPLFLNV